MRCANVKLPCGLSYVHGFHVFKTREVAAVSLERAKRKVSSYTGLRLVEVFWRGYIAEDGSQIVARQVYMPVDTAAPEQEIKILEGVVNLESTSA